MGLTFRGWFPRPFCARTSARLHGLRRHQRTTLHEISLDHSPLPAALQGRLDEAARRRCLSSATRAAKSAQSLQPSRCRAVSATSVAEASPSSTTESVRRARWHVRLSTALNWFPCAPVSVGPRFRGGGASGARSSCASRRLRRRARGPRAPRLTESPRARARPAPGGADGRCRGS
jgi:hypothetical protein